MGRVFDTIVIALYPLIVFMGLIYLSVRWTALLLLILLGRRFVALIFTSKETSVPIIIQVVMIVGLVAGAAVSNSEILLWFTPFGISLTFFAQFALSLRKTPMIERFARLMRPDLPSDHVLYCKTLTKLWLLVLAGNSIMVFGAAFVESQFVWALIVGPVSYVNLGVFAAGEYLFRKRRFQEFNDKNPIDRILKPMLKKSTP